MKLGDVLRKYRLLTNLTLRQLGDAIGISAATLMRIEASGQWAVGSRQQLLATACWSLATRAGKSLAQTGRRRRFGLD